MCRILSRYSYSCELMQAVSVSFSSYRNFLTCIADICMRWYALDARVAPLRADLATLMTFLRKKKIYKLHYTKKILVYVLVSIHFIMNPTIEIFLNILIVAGAIFSLLWIVVMIWLWLLIMRLSKTIDNLNQTTSSINSFVANPIWSISALVSKYL